MAPEIRIGFFTHTIFKGPAYSLVCKQARNDCKLATGLRLYLNDTEYWNNPVKVPRRTKNNPGQPGDPRDQLDKLMRTFPLARFLFTHQQIGQVMKLQTKSFNEKHGAYLRQVQVIGVRISPSLSILSDYQLEQVCPSALEGFLQQTSLPHHQQLYALSVLVTSEALEHPYKWKYTTIFRKLRAKVNDVILHFAEICPMENLSPPYASEMASLLHAYKFSPPEMTTDEKSTSITNKMLELLLAHGDTIGFTMYHLLMRAIWNHANTWDPQFPGLVTKFLHKKYGSKEAFEAFPHTCPTTFRDTAYQIESSIAAWQRQYPNDTPGQKFYDIWAKDATTTLPHALGEMVWNDAVGDTKYRAIKLLQTLARATLNYPRLPWRETELLAILQNITLAPMSQFEQRTLFAGLAAITYRTDPEHLGKALDCLKSKISTAFICSDSFPTSIMYDLQQDISQSITPANVVKKMVEDEWVQDLRASSRITTKNHTKRDLKEFDDAFNVFQKYLDRRYEEVRESEASEASFLLVFREPEDNFVIVDN